jgi:PAS domain S-box-containing protein
LAASGDPPVNEARQPGDASLDFLVGGGEMGALMRGHDWTSSPLGAPAHWPRSLRIAVRLMLNTGHPMYIWWGVEGACLYNDAYRQSIGSERHPSSLGRPAREVWDEIWGIIGPQIEQVMAGRGATWHENQLVPITRNGRREDVYWTYSYSPIDDDSAPNRVGGVLVICSETTQNVLAEQRLAAEIERQRRLFQCAPGFIAILHGPEHVFEFVNEAYIRLVGDRDFLGKPVRAAIPEVEGQGFFELLDTVYRTGKRFIVQQMPIRLRRQQGEDMAERFIDFIYEPMVGEQGDTVGIFVEGFDVTERREAETALHALNATLEARIEERTRERDRVWAHSRDLLVVIGADGVFRAVSPAWTQMLGHTSNEVVGRSFLDFIHPEDAESTQTGLDAAGSGEDLTNFENRYRHKDGGLRWISWHTSFEGDLVFAYGRDITAEKLANDALELSEARLRTIFETSHLFQGLLTPDGILLDANATSLAGIGVPAAAVIGKPFWDTPWFSGTPGMRDAVREGITAVASGQVVRREIWVNLPVGGWRWFDFTLRPMRDGQGEIVAILPEAMELTARKLAEEALHQSQKLEAMGQLTGGVAHDFNNLLAPIVGSLDMLQRRGVGGEREQRLIDGALQSAERASILVQRLLAFARRQPLQAVAVDLASLVTGIAGLVASTTGPQINVVVDVDEGLPAANADPNQLEMAILNLSVNARDAMPQGGTLRISATREDVAAGHRSKLIPGAYVLLSVADTGIGMEESTLARAVEPFFSTKGVGKGTGLGLSMVHGLASQLGGALTISSKRGLGTNVELWLPVSRASAPTAGGAPSGEAAPSIAGTVLLVDDEELVRASTADMLGDLGFAVLEAASAEAALAILESGADIDLLITDHLMAGMTGVDLARAVRDRRPGIPVLIVSGFAEAEGIAPDLPRLTKPFRQADLAASMASLIRS